MAPPRAELWLNVSKIIMVSAHDAEDILNKLWNAGMRAGLRAARPTATAVVVQQHHERKTTVGRFGEQNVCGRNVLLVLVRSNVLVMLACYTCL